MRTALRFAVCFVLLLPSMAYAAENLVIAAASDLQFALPELVQQFEKETGADVKLTFGSSGNFTNQIRNGAPFDMFFSADLSYPQQLEADQLVEPGTVYHYADGRIVLWMGKASKLPLDQGLSILKLPEVKKIAIANPEHAPYGRAKTCTTS
jgi:molybdate transport system substrate-binding protein